MQLLFFFYNFIYLFILGCSRSSSPHGLFSHCGELGLLLVVLWMSHCSDFSCCGAGALGFMGFGNYESQALEHQLNSWGAWAHLLHGVPSQTRDHTRVTCIGRQILYHQGNLATGFLSQKWILIFQGGAGDGGKWPRQRLCHLSEGKEIPLPLPDGTRECLFPKPRGLWPMQTVEHSIHNGRADGGTVGPFC